MVVLQKQSTVVSQGNCGSGLILDQSDTEGLLRYVQQTNSLCNWRSDPELLKAYVMNSGEAVNWVYDRARLNGTSAEKPNDKGLFAYLNTSQDFTGSGRTSDTACLITARPKHICMPLGWAPSRTTSVHS